MEEIMLAIAQYHHVTEQLVAVASILANSVLFVVVVHERSEILKPYARVLLQNCVIDLVYTVVSASMEMQIELWDGYLVVSVRNPLLRAAPASTHFIMMWTWAFVIVATINNSPLMFYFRYMLICRSRRLNSQEIAHALIIPFGCAAIQATILTAALVQHHFTREELCPKLLNIERWIDDDESSWKCMFSDVLNPFLLLYVGAAFVFDITIYTAMVYFSYGVYRVMKDSTYSWKTTQMQRQMNWMLFTQMFVPLFTAIIPVAVIMMFPVLHINIRGVGTAMCMCMSWIPLVSPVTTIALVANFRRRAIRYLLFFTGPLKHKLAFNSYNSSITNVKNNNNTVSNGA